MKPGLLIVDDDEEIRSQMRWALSSDYEVFLSEDRPSALNMFRGKQPRVILLDLGLPPSPGDPKEGMAALADLLREDPLAKVILITGQSDRENALQAIADGAYDFLTKPVQMEELMVTLRRAFYVSELERENVEIRNKMISGGFEEMLGTSPPMREVFSSVQKVARSDAAVLILGESGTGKEMAALAIHRRSPRKEEPFVAINCGAIPENLLESELFGHEKGSFTGAHVQREGRIETAAGGSLFLDEVGELPLTLQVKLLRFLQEKKIERVGGRKAIEVDVRIIAATNSDLTKALADGKFREDLYFRLAVVTIRMPPLRERGADISAMAEAFLKKFSVTGRRGPPKFTKDALLALESYAWPGNVRELQNRVRRAAIMMDGGRITPADLELSPNEANMSKTNLKEAREALEKELVIEALRKNSGNISSAAACLGISRPTFYELLDKYDLRNKS